MLTPPTFTTVARALRTLPDDLESRVHTRFRAQGGDGQRWRRRDVALMADALTRLEDWLELARPRFDRAELRALRRALETSADAMAPRKRAA